MNLRLKKYIKSALSKILGNKEGICVVKVLTGSAKGIKLTLDLKKESSYWLGTYDKWILDRVNLDHIIKPGWVAWDCGAYVGFYASIFRKLVGTNGFVYAFEASKENFDRLKNLPKINNWENVFILNEAVGPDHTVINFISNQGGASGPVTETRGLNEVIKIEQVVSRGVDELVFDMGIKPPNLIKFDLETAEIFALANGDHVYTTYKPILLLELHGRDCLIAASKFLDKYNYMAQDIYFLPEKERAWYSSSNPLSNETYEPHMLYCTPTKN